MWFLWGDLKREWDSCLQRKKRAQLCPLTVRRFRLYRSRYSEWVAILPTLLGPLRNFWFLIKPGCSRGHSNFLWYCFLRWYIEASTAIEFASHHTTRVYGSCLSYYVVLSTSIQRRRNVLTMPIVREVSNLFLWVFFSQICSRPTKSSNPLHA